MELMKNMGFVCLKYTSGEVVCCAVVIPSGRKLRNCICLQKILFRSVIIIKFAGVTSHFTNLQDSVG